MNKEEYMAIHLKFEKDRNDILKEISDLQKRKEQNIKKIDFENRKLRSFNQAFLENKIVKASQLQHTYNPTEVNKAKKEIAVIDNFIREQNIELEKIMEKQKQIKRMYQEKMNEDAKIRRKREEEGLFEMKNIIKQG